MITLERFDTKRAAAHHALESVNAHLSAALGQTVEITLAARADGETLDRMLELEHEIFAIEDNVYSREDILSCLREEDSLLLLLRIDGRLEGYVFGYDEDVDHPIVEGTDYFLDSALVSSAYEQKGIGAAAAVVVLLLLYLMDYRAIGITTEVRDKTGRELVKFYKKLGFIDGVTDSREDYAMKIDLNDEIIARLGAPLGIGVEGRAE